MTTSKTSGGVAIGFDDDHHAMMNGPRIAQSLPPDYLDALLKQATQPTPPTGAQEGAKDNE